MEVMEDQIPIEPLKEISLQRESFNNWDFFYCEEKVMANSQLDMVLDKVKVDRLPENLYGYNRFYFVNSSNDFIYEINPLQMLDCTSFNERNSRLLDKTSQTGDKITENLNYIYYIPNDLKETYLGGLGKMSIDGHLSDWTMSSSYMGFIAKLSSTKLISHFPCFDLFKDYPKIAIKPTEKALPIPIEFLGKANPILKYIEINLYSDPISGNGLSEASFRFRIMRDCFFGLLRSYLRINDIMIRVLDTRIFHSFSENYILREFKVKENSIEDLLTNKGINLASEMTTLKTDLISKYLDTIFCATDTIILNNSNI